MPAISIFVSYSHEDSRWFEEDSLIPWLARSLKRDGVELWWDHDGLAGGDPWRAKIEEEIDRAQIALLLVSQGFLNSEFIEKVELPRIKARAERNEMVVIPILTEPCEWDDQEFISSRQMVPSKATPLINFLGPGREADWAQARFEILSAVKRRLRNLPAARSAAPPTVGLPSEPATEPHEDAIPRHTPWPLEAGQRRLLMIAVPVVLVLIVAGALFSTRPGGQAGGVPATATAALGVTPVPTLAVVVPSPTVAAPALSPTPQPAPTAALLPAAPISPENAARIQPYVTLRGHAGSVMALAFSPVDGSLFSAGQDGAVKVWDVERGAERPVFGARTREILAIALSPDGQRLAAATADSMVRFWDTASGKEIGALGGFKQWLWSIAYSPGGKTLAMGDAEGVKLWEVGEVAQASAVRRLQAPWPVPPAVSVAFSPDGKTLAHGGVSDPVILWDVKSAQALRPLQGHTDWVGGVAFSPDGKTLASVSRDHTVRLWEWQSDKESRLLVNNCGLTADPQSSPPISIAFSPDGKLLVSACKQKTVNIWEVATGKLLTSLNGHEQDVSAVAFSADGRFIASAGLDQTVRVWAVTAAVNSAPVGAPPISPANAGAVDVAVTLRRPSSSAPANGIAFSPDGRLVATGGCGRVVSEGHCDESALTVLWEVDTGRVLRTLAEHADWVWSVAFSPDGKSLASASKDATVKLWDVSSGQMLRSIEYPGPLEDVTISPDGRLLAAAGQEGAGLWDTASGRPLRMLMSGGREFAVAFSPDGKLVASKGGSGKVCLLKVESAEEVWTRAGHNGPVTAIAFSPDGKLVASAGEDAIIKLWDVASGKELRALAGHTAMVWDVTFSPDGQVLASGSKDRTVVLWEVSSGRQLTKLSRHANWVTGIVFSPDGTTVASSSGDSTVRLWRVKP